MKALNGATITEERTEFEPRNPFHIKKSDGDFPMHMGDITVQEVNSVWPSDAI